MSAVAMLAQRWLLGIAALVVVSSCIIVLRNLFTRRYYDVDYRPARFQPVRHPKLRNIPNQKD